jgi:hypothetical protein
VKREPPDDSPLLGSTPNEFVVPAIGQAGAPFPIVGPFGGEARDTTFTVNGVGAILLSVSTRVAFVQLPGSPAGNANYELRKGAFAKRGAVRLLGISVSYPDNTRVKKGDLVADVKGLSGFSEPIALHIESHTPFVGVGRIIGEYGYGPFTFIKPQDVPADGMVRLKRSIGGNPMGRVNEPIDISVRLVIPTTAEHQVRLLLSVPPVHPSPEQYAAMLRAYMPQSLFVLSKLLDVWGAYQIMAAMDPDQAAPLIMPEVNSSLDKQLRGEAILFYARRVARIPDVPYRQLVHDTAVQHVEQTVPTGTTNGFNCCESRQAAVFALGLVGSDDDIPLLERWFKQWDLEGPARAALARLGSASYIAQIKATLDAPLATPFTEFDAMKITGAIQTARFSERRELIPSLCRHLHTPGFADADIILSTPASDAFEAIQALLGHRTTAEEVAGLCR